MAVNNYNILIVGDSTSAKELSSKLININSGMSLAGYVQRGAGSTRDKKYLGPVNQMNRIIREKNIRELVIAHSGNDYNGLFELIETCRKEKLPIKIQSPLFSVVEQKLESEKLGDVEVISLAPRDTFYTRYGKRILDIIGALTGLVLMLPLFIILAVLIKATSPGPVFFKQQRIGKNGKIFKFYKFRSMYQAEGEDEERAKIMKEFINKEKIDSGDAKVVNTARVTKIGKIIRKTSVDELPQFYNVLKGDMSLVGPRPEVPYVYEVYKDWQKQRVTGLPGCTGVWQVTARSRVTFNEMVMLDIYYLNNISFALDMSMILKTIPVMFFSKGGR
jgi:undecaprenyl-phosphate galactose phosphotransferase